MESNFYAQREGIPSWLNKLKSFIILWAIKTLSLLPSGLLSETTTFKNGKFKTKLLTCIHVITQ